MPVLPVFRPLRDALVGARSSRTRSLLSRPLLSCPLLSRCGIPGPGFCGGSVRRRRVSARSSTVRAFPAFCPCLAAAPFVRFGRSGPTALLGPRFAGRSGRPERPQRAGRSGKGGAGGGVFRPRVPEAARVCVCRLKLYAYRKK